MGSRQPVLSKSAHLVIICMSFGDDVMGTWLADWVHRLNECIQGKTDGEE